MGRMHEYYDDPLTFKPERWLQEDKPKSLAFIPFLSGPRTCLGQQMVLTDKYFDL
jgi:cytochrome P450